MINKTINILSAIDQEVFESALISSRKIHNLDDSTSKMGNILSLLFPFFLVNLTRRYSVLPTRKKGKKECYRSSNITRIIVIDQSLIMIKLQFEIPNKC